MTRHLSGAGHDGERPDGRDRPSARPVLPDPEERGRTGAGVAAGIGDSPAASCRLVTGAEEARRAVAALAERDDPVGLGLAATGPDPLAHRARLLLLAPADGPALAVDLDRSGGLPALREPLWALWAVAHGATSPMAFLRRAGVGIVPDCTLLAGHVLTGRAEDLPASAERHLGIRPGTPDHDREEPLTEGGLRRATREARVVRRLWPALERALERRGSVDAYRLARDAQPAVVDMELRGMPLDAPALRDLAARLGAERDRLRAALGEVLGGLSPSSGPQLGGWLAGALGGPGSPGHAAWPRTGGGRLATGADGLRDGLALLPEGPARVVTGLLLPYKLLEKRCSTYGAGLADRAHPATGRVHARYHLAGTVTGRMSSSGPNMQNMPRDPAFRSLFRAPEGRALVIADYDQVELRVAAQLAGEGALLAAYREGRDAHALTAAAILGKAPGEVSRAERQLAKAVNFGLLYGQGARGLRAYAAACYGVEMSLAEARRHRAAWFAAYPAIAAWQERAAASAWRTLAVRTPAGRERRWPRAGWGVPGGLRETEAYNTPVQGGAAEAMLAALAELGRRLAASGLDAAPVAVVHDEVLLEAAEGDAAAAARLLEAGMADGMLAVFPDAPVTGLVEARVGRSWADK